LVKKNSRDTRPVRKPPIEIDPESNKFFVVAVFAVLFLCLVGLFADFLFSNKMLYGSDIIQAGIFFRGFYVDFVKEHFAIPQWNPHIFGGLPFVEAFHGDIFYPFSFLKFFVELHRYFGLVFFWHIFFSGIFMYLCARQFKLSKGASAFAGACYMFAGYLISFVAPGHDGKIFVTTLFPLVVLFEDKGFEKRPFLNFTLLGLVIGLIIISPHAQMAYFTLWVVSLYGAFKLFFLFRERGFASCIKPAGLITYAVVIGLALSAIQFYPGYIYTSDFSPRAEDDSKSGWDWATSWSLHEEEAMALLIPEFPGVTSHSSETVYWGKNAFKDNSEAVSVVGLLVALVGMFFARRREGWFFGGLALFALLYALGDTTPMFRLFYLIPKVSSLRAPSMIMFLFSFSIALLAAMGWQYVVDRREGGAQPKTDKTDSRLNYLLIGFPGLLFVLAILFSAAGPSMIRAWCSLFFPEALSAAGPMASKLPAAMHNLGVIQSGAWISFLVLALASGLIWIYRKGWVGRWALLGLILIVALNGIRFNSRFVSVISFDQVIKETPAKRFLDQQTGLFRVADFSRLNGNLLPTFGYDIPYGYHGNQLRWYDELAGGPGMASGRNPRFVNLMGDKWLLVRGGTRLPPNYFGPLPVQKVSELGSTDVYRNDNALPRLYLATRFRVFGDRKEIYPEVLQGVEDLRRTVLLEEEPSLDIVYNPLSTDSTWMIDYDIDSIRIGVHSTQNQMLVLTDTWYDSWQVYVDGQKTPLLRSYGALRAVAIPAGAKEVVMAFESERYKTGRMITWLTMVYLAIVFGLLAFVGLRKKSQMSESAT
jgi:hypothetical protein